MPRRYTKVKKRKSEYNYERKNGKKVNVPSHSQHYNIRTYRNIPRAQAKEAFNTRSKRAKTLDLRTRSKLVKKEPDEEWLEHPDKSDVEGIDVPDAWRYDWKQKAKQQDEMEKATLAKKHLVTHLPVTAPIGSQYEMIIRTLNGEQRKITFEKTKGRGKNKNLKWKIVDNQPYPPKHT